MQREPKQNLPTPKEGANPPCFRHPKDLPVPRRTSPINHDSTFYEPITVHIQGDYLPLQSYLLKSGAADMTAATKKTKNELQVQ